jgi:hypothetical protein
MELTRLEINHHVMLIIEDHYDITEILLKVALNTIKQTIIEESNNYHWFVACYTSCIEILPDKVVSYTNRSLCYLRLNKVCSMLYIMYRDITRQSS